MNTLRKASTQPTNATEQPTKKQRISIIKVFDLENYLNLPWLQRNGVYILFLSGLILVYIGLTHRAEKTIKQIYQAERELKDLRSDYISIKSELMYMSKASEVEKQVLHLGLHPLQAPPKKLIGGKP